MIFSRMSVPWTELWKPEIMSPSRAEARVKKTMSSSRAKEWGHLLPIIKIWIPWARGSSGVTQTADHPGPFHTSPVKIWVGVSKANLWKQEPTRYEATRKTVTQESPVFWQHPWSCDQLIVSLQGGVKPPELHRSSHLFSPLLPSKIPSPTPQEILHRKYFLSMSPVWKFSSKLPARMD